MYTLKGIFPEPKKEQKKNFIRENMKQLKFKQGKSPTEPKYTLKTVHPPRPAHAGASGAALCNVKSSPSSKSGKVSLSVGKISSTSSRKKLPDVRIKKGDMAEFLKRKEQLHSKELKDVKDEETEFEDDLKSSESSGRLRDIACQTIESNLAHKLTESTRLTMLYPKKEEEEAKKASGDFGSYTRNIISPTRQPRKVGDESTIEAERNNSRLNAILERKDHKDPYLPSGYQKGVVPGYLRARKASNTPDVHEDSACPPGHVTLSDAERKETLRMLRNSFAELVSELNKMPVKTDTLRMRNRKIELEKQLSKLEEGIKVFSRPKVFVKIGE